MDLSIKVIKVWPSIDSYNLFNFYIDPGNNDDNFISKVQRKDIAMLGKYLLSTSQYISQNLHNMKTLWQKIV